MTFSAHSDKDSMHLGSGDSTKSLGCRMGFQDQRIPLPAAGPPATLIGRGRESPLKSLELAPFLALAPDSVLSWPSPSAEAAAFISPPLPLPLHPALSNAYLSPTRRSAKYQDLVMPASKFPRLLSKPTSRCCLQKASACV